MTVQKQKHILVTGATGLVGSYLLWYLIKEGYTNVRACRRPESSMELVTSIQDQVEWVVCDILNIDELEDAMDGVLQIYHCAALVSSGLLPARYLETNCGCPKPNPNAAKA